MFCLIGGWMTQTIGGGVEALRASMAGAVVTPDDVEFEQARKVWNADIDHRPAVVAQVYLGAGRV